MKTALVILFFALSFSASAQSFYRQGNPSVLSLEVSPMANRTVYGWQYGARVGFNYQARLKGGFVRTEAMGNGEQSRKNFTGGYFQYVINPDSKLRIQPAMRIGFYDTKFLAIQPTIEAAYQLKPALSVNAGVGKVDGFMSLDFGFSWKLNLTR